MRKCSEIKHRFAAHLNLNLKMVSWGWRIEAENTFAKIHTLLEKVSIMLNENGALIIKHLSFFPLTILDGFHTVANLGWMLKWTRCETYKLSHTCKIRKLNKVGVWHRKLFEFVIHHDTPREKNLKSEFKKKSTLEKTQVIICEMEHMFHTALVVEFLMFVYKFCTIIVCL